ncbi:MAG: mechanosensitive ion channel family protein [Saprospiraceae bacterium]
MKEQLLSNLSYIGIFIGIILGTMITALLVNRFFKRLIKRSTEVMKNDPTNYLFLRHSIVALVYLVGISTAIYVMPNLRGLANSMLAGAGILAVAIGFASQKALSNIISGVFIIIFKPFRVNDRLKLRELTGIVEDITLRHTVIKDLENRRILIPNALISEEIIINSNFGDEKICKWINIGISYDSDIEKAKAIMREEVLAHPLHIDARTPAQIEKGKEIVEVRVVNLGAYSVDLRAWAWAKDAPDAFAMSCDLLESIKKRFSRENIEIPYPYHTLVFKNTEHEQKET